MSAQPLEPRDAAYKDRVQASFSRQAFMAALGARLDHIAPGEVVIVLPFRRDLTQQDGLLHAGAAAAVLDSACGYAALSLMPPGAGVLSVEFKINLLAPASGTRFRACGRVLRAGRTLSVCAGDMHADGAGREVVVAVMQATMIGVTDREGGPR